MHIFPSSSCNVSINVRSKTLSNRKKNSVVLLDDRQKKMLELGTSALLQPLLYPTFHGRLLLFSVVVKHFDGEDALIKT